MDTLRLAVICCCFVGTLSIEINYVKVPNAVQNNTNRSAVLDCNYSIRPDDTDLVVQWFLNEELVYQWIPPGKPQSLGVLKNAIDVQYKATDDPKTVYRAMKIINPLTKMAGEYKCSAATLGDGDFRIKNMIVFETRLSLRQSTREQYVNFTCLAENVFPSPKLLIYKDASEERMRLPVIQWDLRKNHDKRYTMFIVATDLVHGLTDGTLIHCELKIPGTGYVKTKSLLYYPEGMELIGCGYRGHTKLTSLLFILVSRAIV